MEHSVLNDILILLTVAIVVVTVFRRLGLPAILGYLCVGLIAGPYGFGWLVFDDVILFLGELGIVFLLFSIGLEFSLPALLLATCAVVTTGSVAAVYVLRISASGSVPSISDSGRANPPNCPASSCARSASPPTCCRASPWVL